MDWASRSRAHHSTPGSRPRRGHGGRLTGLTYVSNVQARRDAAGSAALLEVNPRRPRGDAADDRRGVDMPWLTLDLLRGLPVPEHVDFHEVAMVRFLDERFMDLSEVQKVAA